LQTDDAAGSVSLRGEEERFLFILGRAPRAPHARPLASETMYWEDDDVEALQRAVALEEAEAAASATRAARAKHREPAAAAPAPPETHPPASDRVAALESRVAALVAERDAMERSLLAARAETRALRDSRSSELADARAEADETTARVKRAEADAAQSAAAASRARREADRAEFEARAQVEQLETVIKALETKLTRVTGEKHETERRLGEARAETRAADARAARWKTGSDEGFALRRRLSKTNEDLMRTIQETTERLAFAEAKSASLLGAVAARDAKLAARGAEAEAAASRLAAARDAGARADAERERLRAALAEARAIAPARSSERRHSSPRDENATKTRERVSQTRSGMSDVAVDGSLTELAEKKKSPGGTNEKRGDTNMHASTRRGLRARDANAPQAPKDSPLASPGKAKARRFAAAAKRATVAAAVGAGAWRAVRDRGGLPAAVPLFVV